MENKLEKIGQNSFMDNFVKTDDILNDMCGIIESSQRAAYQAVNIALVQRNWLLGYRIAEEELSGQERSEYGLQVVKKLSKELTNRYGKGYAFVARQQHIHTEKRTTISTLYSTITY